MAEQEIDKLLLEIEVDDKTQGGSKKLVDDFATAVSKLNAEIAKLDVSKFETIAKAMSAIGNVGGGAAKGGTSQGGVRNIIPKPEELKQAEKNLKDLRKEYDKFVKSGMKQESLDIYYKNSGIPEQEALVAELSKKWKDAQDEAKQAMKIETPQAQGGTAPQIDAVQEKTSKSVETFEKVNSQLELSQRKLAIVNAELEKSGLTEKKYLSLKQQQLRLEKQISNEQNKQEKTSKSGLLSSIKRVAIYRAIRGILKSITNAFKEGFSNLAQYSSGVNGTLSQLNSSFAVMKNSVAVAFLPLLNAITPVVQQISVGIANLANSISYLSAKLHGNTQYLKVNTEYLEEMNKQSNLLSFDTFEKLGSGVDYSNMFKKTNVADGFDNEKLASSLSILGAISGVILAIGASKLLGWITSGSLTKSITSIGKSLSTGAGTLGIIIAGVALLAAGIADLVLSWNDVNFEGWEKALTIVAALIAGVVGLVVAVKALKMPIAAAIGLGMALAGAVALIGTEASKSTPKNYAFGGGYNSADLFYANENGQTELIASTNSGGGAVMNMQQLESAIYSGMVKAMASGQNGESAIYLDGNKVGTFIAGNNGFRSEANRRNTGLNWR